ncbi:MAG TPA: sialidase family protein [Actinomycetota bacterium]|nr:sialidase family protein [Actinomycetota bacterium]
MKRTAIVAVAAAMIFGGVAFPGATHGLPGSSLTSWHDVHSHEQEVEADPISVYAAKHSPLRAELGKHAVVRGITYVAGSSSRKKAGKRPRGEMFNTGVLGAEPTLGVTSSGTVFFKGLDTSDTSGLAWPLVATSDNGKTWTEVGGQLGPTRTHAFGQDPYFYVDPATDRIFDNDWTGPCTQLSFSDNEGETWQESTICSLTDHQNIFGGPPATSTPIGYPNVVYYCAIDAGALAFFGTATSCVKSIDGGLTWVRTGLPAFTDDPTMTSDGMAGIPGHCGGATGPGFVDTEGVVYLPRGFCDAPYLAISEDEGATWRRIQVADNGMPGSGGSIDNPLIWEHEAGVVVDPAGNIYYVYTARNRLPYLVVSRDGGETWGKPIMIGPPGIKEAWGPVIALGSKGGLALAYVGSTDAPGGDAPDGAGSEYDEVTWHGYMSVTTNPLAKRPRFHTSGINPVKDPLIVGSCAIIRCGVQFDFIDVVIAPDGTPWAAFVDGCTPDGRCVPLGAGVAGQLTGAPKL